MCWPASGHDGGGLTVVRRTPEVKVLRRQAPESVGVQSHVNDSRDADGKWNDELETGPLQSWTAMGATKINEVIRFSIEADAVSHLRLSQDGVGAASQAPALRGEPDGQNRQLPRSSLTRARCRPLLASYARAPGGAARPGEMTDGDATRPCSRCTRLLARSDLTRRGCRHLGLLVPLIEKVATRLHLDTYIGVRRFEKPLLMTGAEPVVVFPNADFSKGLSTGKLLSTGETPIEPWQKHEKLLEQIDERLHEIAGCAVALDPYTLLLMFHAETDDGGKLAVPRLPSTSGGWQASMNLLLRRSLTMDKRAAIVAGAARGSLVTRISGQSPPEIRGPADD